MEMKIKCDKMEETDMGKELFPDGSVIGEWFYDTTVPKLEELGTPYVLTQYGILDDGTIHTKQIQELIDKAAAAVAV